jgi:dihydroneopterin aldolase
MDKIMFKGMQFYAYHGVFPEENKLGQSFLVDLDVFMDLKPAGESDELEKTINYADLYGTVQVIVEGERYQLIETIAEKIASQALQTFQPIEEIMVRITKPNPPIPGHFDAVAVEIRRKR